MQEILSSKWMTISESQMQVWCHISTSQTWPWLSLSACLTPYQRSILEKSSKSTELLRSGKATRESVFWNQMTNLPTQPTPVRLAFPLLWINDHRSASKESTMVICECKHRVWHRWATTSWRLKISHPQVKFLTTHTRMIKTDKMSVISKRSFIEQVKPKAKSSWNGGRRTYFQQPKKSLAVLRILPRLFAILAN